MNSGIAWLTTTCMGTTPVRGVVPLSVAVMVNWYSRGIRMEEFATNIIPDVTAPETEVVLIPKGVPEKIVKLRAAFLPSSVSWAETFGIGVPVTYESSIIIILTRKKVWDFIIPISY